MTEYSFARKLVAEAIGTVFLLATVVGSGIMAESLAGGNVAIALLGNTLATGCILMVLILIFGPVSGAHFNPAVTLSFWLQRQISGRDAVFYVIVHIIAAIAGAGLAHIMFDIDLGLRPFKAGSRALCGRPVHFRRLLVHLFHVIRQSGCDDRPHND